MDLFGTYLKALEDEEEDAIVEVIRELTNEVVTLVGEVDGLKRDSARQANLIDKLQKELIKAGRYENENLDTRLDGIQFLLKRAGEVQPRQKGNRR